MVWVVTLLVLGGCGGGDGAQRLVIEFFDPATEGITRQEGSVTVDEAFDGEPLIVINEADIVSWDPDGVWGHMIQLERSQKTSDLGSSVRSGVRLLFRLSIDGDSFWGYVSVFPTAVTSDPSLIYEGYITPAFDHLFYLGSRDIVINGVDLVEAARQAWLD